MTSIRWGYARVSRPDQTTAQQEEALSKAGCDQIFVETASGAKRDRPKLAELMKFAREGDTIVIWKLDRLARSLQHLIDLANTMKQRGIELQSLTDNIDTSTASGRLLFNMLSSIAEFERDIITERVGAGLARARAAGRVGGRPKVDQCKVDVAMANIARGESIAKAAAMARISVSTLKRLVRGSKTSNAGFDPGQGFEPVFDPQKGKLNGVGTTH